MILFIGIDGEKKKEREMKTRMLFPIINPSSHSALIPAQYAPISTVTDRAHDNDTMIVSVLRDNVVSYRFTHSIIE